VKPMETHFAAHAIAFLDHRQDVGGVYWPNVPVTQST
jgi:hypothetical protein